MIDNNLTMADFHLIYGSHDRLRIFQLLMNRRYTATQLVIQTGIPQTTVYNHIKILYENGYIQRVGYTVENHERIFLSNFDHIILTVNHKGITLTNEGIRS